MRKLATLMSAAALATFGFAGAAWALECTTIQDGILETSEGVLITPGYDDWGYNYEARIFNGGYCDSYRDAEWCQPYVDVDLMMKWNDAWLSNKDCDNDGLLDRHFVDPTYIDSGAWLTNHQSGKVEVNGRPRKWTYFIKIIAVTSDAEKVNDVPSTCDDDPNTEEDECEPSYTWYAPDGTEIGPVIWGQFAVVQEVLNDPSNGDHGILYLSPSGPGLGNLE